GLPGANSSSVRLVDRALVDRERGFVDGFGKGRVGVDDAREILRCTLEFHRHDRFGDEFGYRRADHVHAEDAIGFGVRDDLDLARGLVHRNRAADRRERERTGLVRDARFLELRLGPADPGDFRFRVDDPRDRFEVDVAGLARDEFGDHDAFLGALVREHRAAYAVTDRPHAFDAGPAVLVDFDAAAIVELDAGSVGEQAAGCRAAADRDQQL